MDEAELRDAMAEAPDETPPASFDIDEIRAHSRRAVLRRRAVVAGASTFAVLVLAGAGVFGIVMNTDTSEPTVTMARSNDGSAAPGSASEGSGQKDPAAGQPTGVESGPTDKGFSGLSPKQGGDGSAENGQEVPSDRSADSTDRCDKVDRKLVNALADELPGTGPQKVTCAPNGNSATLHVATGKVTVVLLDYPLPDTYKGPPGAITVTRGTPGGGTILLTSIPTSDTKPAPLRGELKRIAGELAARF